MNPLDSYLSSQSMPPVGTSTRDLAVRPPARTYVFKRRLNFADPSRYFSAAPWILPLASYAPYAFASLAVVDREAKDPTNFFEGKR